MNSIGDFFGRFKNIALVELRKREVILEAIAEATSHKIEAKDLSIRDGVVIIKSNSILKSEIFLKKEKILSLIKKKLPTLKIYDIK